MAASGGGTAPTPPKRPTIIRPSNESGVSIPSRPAPPVQGGDPPVPNRPCAPDPVPSRPKPPTPPSRPVSVHKPVPPPPARPELSKPSSNTGVFSKPSDKSNGTAGKKKIEITIVSARPMSEIGFRDTKPSVPAGASFEAPTSQPSSQLPAATFSGPQRGDEEKHDVSDSKAPSRGPPPPVPRSPRTRGNDAHDNFERSESISTEHEVKHRGPPPPVPRPSVIKPTVLPPGASHRHPPPVPGRPQSSPGHSLDKPSVDELLDLNVNNNDPHHTLLPKHLDAPHVLPRAPPTKTNSPSQEGVNMKTDEIHQSERNPDHTLELHTSSEKDSDIHAVSAKPKRPTIIRPNRPSVVKSDPDRSNENNTDVDNKTIASDNRPIAPPKVIPRVPRTTENDTESNQVSLEKTKQENEVDSADNQVPEFLRKKLKPTVEDTPDRNKTEGTGPTAGGGPPVPLKPRPLSSRGPPPPMKPKPSILPKPQVAAKPRSSATVADTIEAQQLGKNEIEESKSDSQADPVSTAQSQQSCDLSDNQGDSQPVKPTMVKRPTIIRPSRSLKSGSVENVNRDTNEVTEKSNKLVKPFSDDSAIGSKSQIPPPLPNKRPVSLINIHKAVENDDGHISEGLNIMSSRSNENVSETSKPKPSPRPAARSRPMSMMVPPVSRPPMPSAGPKLDKSSPPHRPQARPSFKNPAREEELKHETEKSEDNVKTGISFGVAVLPQPDTDKSGPPKPVRRPPPPKHSPRKTDDSDDEEFVTANDRPERPAAGPMKKISATSRRYSSDEETVKPPRPGPPPSPRKSSFTSSPMKDAEDHVTTRPARPGSKPLRPVSMPVKQILPSKPQPPRPQGSRESKKGSPPLPSRPGPGHPLYFYMMQVPHGIALHDYTAQHDDELSFKTGDLIVLERRVDGEWIMGKLNEHEGMFPQDFIKVKMPLPGETVADDDSSNDSAEIYYDASAEKPDTIGKGPRCRARFDFDGEGPDDLVFEEGDVIRLIDRVGLEWRKGEINGRIGLFPLSFVEIIEDLPEEKDADIGNVVKAVFDFEGEAGDLDFQAGESISVTHMVNEEWLYGEIGSRKGQFPVQFVDHVPHELPPLARDVSDSKGDHSEDKISASLAKWDDHEEPSTVTMSEVTPSSASHTESSSGFVSMATSPSSTPYCIATYDYPAQTDSDLGFSEGDHIELVERINADWLKGKLGDKVGMFPSAFVDVKVDIEIKASHAAPSPEKVEQKVYGTALYEFTGEADNELTFKEGDRFVVEEHVEGAEDWRWGVIDGHRGMFPAAFVQAES